MATRRRRHAVLAAMVATALASCGGGESSSGGDNVSVPDVPARAIAEHEPKASPQASSARSVRGRAFRAERAILENGQLTLRDGDDFFPTRGISFRVPQDVLNGTRELDGDEAFGEGAGILRLQIMESGDSLPDTDMVFSSDYEMRLSFGEAGALDVPFEISLIVPGAEPTRVNGRFVATFGDIRTVDGELDPTYDSFDTLNELASRHVASAYPGAAVLDTSRHGYSTAGTGAGHVDIRMEDGTTRALTLGYGRDDDGWRVDRELEPGSPATTEARTSFMLDGDFGGEGFAGASEDALGGMLGDGLDALTDALVPE